MQQDVLGSFSITSSINQISKKANQEELDDSPKSSSSVTPTTSTTTTTIPKSPSFSSPSSPSSPSSSSSIAFDESKPVPLYKVAISGGFAGMIADFSLHSIDTVKTRLQGQPTSIPTRYHNTPQTFFRILKEEGVTRGLYSGVSANMIGSFPATFTYFASYELAKRNLIQYFPEFATHFISGAIGDFCASLIHLPSEVVKTRMQLQGRFNNPHRITTYNYRNTLHVIQSLYSSGGLKSFFTGYRATISREIPFSAIQFAIYEELKSMGIKMNMGEELTNSQSLFCGAAAGGIAGALTTPADVIKTRLQTKSSGRNYGVFEGLKNLLKHEGIRGLTKGIGARVMWTIPHSSILFASYEYFSSASKHL